MLLPKFLALLIVGSLELHPAITGACAHTIRQINHVPNYGAF